MATASRTRPCVELGIHDDHSHKASGSGATTSALGELPLNNIHNFRPRTSIESLAHQLDNFHIHGSDKENNSRLAADASPSRVSSATPSTKDIACGHSHELSGAGTSAVSEGMWPPPRSARVGYAKRVLQTSKTTPLLWPASSFPAPRSNCRGTRKVSLSGCSPSR